MATAVTSTPRSSRKNVALHPKWEEELKDPSRQLVKELSSRLSKSGDLIISCPRLDAVVGENIDDLAFFPLPAAATEDYCRNKRNPGSSRITSFRKSMGSSRVTGSLDLPASTRSLSYVPAYDVPAMPRLPTLPPTCTPSSSLNSPVIIKDVEPPRAEDDHGKPKQENTEEPNVVSTGSHDEYDVNGDDPPADLFDYDWDTDMNGHCEFMADEIWHDVPLGAPDAILGIASAFKACNDPRKVNVCVGAYRDAEGLPWVLPSVRLAERKLWDDQQIKEYLPIEGDKDFIAAAMEFAYGPSMSLDHLAAVQTVSCDEADALVAAIIMPRGICSLALLLS